MSDERKPAGTAAGRRPAAEPARELLIRELGAILAAWGATVQDDELLAPLASAVAELLAPGPDEGARA